MSIRFRCKKCNQKYELDDDCSGDTLDCGRCKAPMLVPQKSEIPPSASGEKTAAPSGEVPIAENKKDEIREVRIASGTSKNKDSGDIVFRCKKCNQKYSLSKEFAGQTAECAKCKNEIAIPMQPDNAPASAAARENVIFWCSACGHKLCMPKELAGQTGECTKCRRTFKIPAESEAKLAGMLSRLKQEVSAKSDAPAKILSKTSPPANVEEPPGMQDKSPEQDADNKQTSASGWKAAITPIKYILEMPKRTFRFVSFSRIMAGLLRRK